MVGDSYENEKYHDSGSPGYTHRISFFYLMK